MARIEPWGVSVARRPCAVHPSGIDEVQTPWAMAVGVQRKVKKCVPPSLSEHLCFFVSLFLCLPASRFVFVIVRTSVTSAYEFATSCFSLSGHLRVRVYTRTNMPMYAHVMYVDHDYR